MARDNAPLIRPLYNSTYHLYRLSPLHLRSTTPSFASDAVLRTHARRLAEHLQRDAQLGLGVAALGLGEESETLARAGSLRRTLWTWMSAEGSPSGADDSDDQDRERDAPALIEMKGGADGFGHLEGLRVTLEFERATYTALLLRRATGEDENADADRTTKQVYLPLALLRMPVALRSAVFSYLGAHFDARADTVRIAEKILAECLEAYLSGTAGAAGTGNDSDNDAAGRRGANKDVQLSLAFPGPELRSIDVQIRGEDVAGFMQRGAHEQRQQESGKRTNAAAHRAGANGETGPQAQSMSAGPFTTAIAAYLRMHLALDTTHAAVRLSRVACAAFALGREGRVKLFAPTGRGRDEGDVAVEGAIEGLWAVVRGEQDAQDQGT